MYMKGTREIELYVVKLVMPIFKLLCLDKLTSVCFNISSGKLRDKFLSSKFCIFLLVSKNSKFFRLRYIYLAFFCVAEDAEMLMFCTEFCKFEEFSSFNKLFTT